VDHVALLEDLLGLLKTLNETLGVPGESLEDKNVLQGNNPSDPNKRVKPILTSSEKKRTTEIATLFAKTFFEYRRKNTKDTALKTSVGKIAGPVVRRESNKAIPAPPSNKVGLVLMGVLALLGGAGALLLGLLTDGPFKGALKILSKIGIKGGLKMLMSGAKLFMGTLTKFVTAPFKMVGKLFGKGMFAKMFGFLKPLLKVLKKLPLIGSMISIGFAISRFNKGQVVRGVIDVVSALAGLLYLVPGGAFVALPLTIGLDVLNAWMDVRAAKPENKGRSEMDILGDITKTVGKWIMDHSMYLPIIGGIRRWGMSYDAFKSGDVGEGIRQMGYGLMAFVGGEGLAKGFEMLMGLFGGRENSDRSLTPDNSWGSRLKEWIKNKLKDLPTVLRKPLEWMGIIDESGESTISWGEIKDVTSFVADKVKNFVGPLWDSVWNAFSDGFNWFGEKIPEWFDSIKSVFNVISDTVKSLTDKVKNFLKDFAARIISWVKNLWPFGGGGDEKKEMPNDQKLKKAQEAGHASWEDYKKSGWKWVSNNTPESPTAYSPPKIPIIQSGNENGTNALEHFAKSHLKAMEDIRWVSVEILKQLKGGLGGNTSVVIPMPQQTSSGDSKSDPMSMNSNRGDYGSSPYALA
jgi:hypothetical protein